MTDSAESLVEKNLNWNFSVNVLDNMFYALAISLVSQETIMPLLVSELTDSTIAVGLIPAIFSLSFLLPQLFVANHAERLPRKLPFVLLGSGLLQRLPYPLIGIALLLFALSKRRVWRCCSSSSASPQPLLAAASSRQPGSA